MCTCVNVASVGLVALRVFICVSLCTLQKSRPVYSSKYSAAVRKSVESIQWSKHALMMSHRLCFILFSHSLTIALAIAFCSVQLRWAQRMRSVFLSSMFQGSSWVFITAILFLHELTVSSLSTRNLSDDCIWNVKYSQNLVTLQHLHRIVRFFDMSCIFTFCARWCNSTCLFLTEIATENDVRVVAKQYLLRHKCARERERCEMGYDGQKAGTREK